MYKLLDIENCIFCCCFCSFIDYNFCTDTIFIEEILEVIINCSMKNTE